MYVSQSCPIAAIRAEARYAAEHPSLTFKLWRGLKDTWLRRQDQQHARILATIDHPGIHADFQRASHG
jgi:hypothetical protein